MEIINVNTVDVIQPDSSTELLGLQKVIQSGSMHLLF